KSDYYGPYNKLLCILFPPGSRFTIEPQYTSPASVKACNFLVSFDSSHGFKPVFIVELKKPDS
ncbi:hypothetical protein PISMIDRAFT_54878, partial [Pisolithus microcarpus 441]